MRRQEKYPETETFHYHNQNPKNRITGDCTIRAISLAGDVPYNDVVMDLAKIQCETGYDQCCGQGIDLLMKKYGWIKCKQPRKADNKKYTGDEFCKLLNQSPDCAQSYFCNIGGNHQVCIKPYNGKYKVWDIWNSTDGCIGNYWRK